MDKNKMIIALAGALALPGSALADRVEITGDTGIRIPAGVELGASSRSYFGLKGGQDLFSHLSDKVIQYWTPNFNGLNAHIEYATDLKSGSLVSENAGSFSFSLDYKVGQASAFVSSENDWGGNAFGLTRSAAHLGTTYDFSNGTRFGLGYGQLRYNVAAGRGGFSNAPESGVVRMNDWYLSLVQDLGSSDHIRFSFTQVDAGSVQGAANQFSLGYGHALSERTEVYALYTKTSNGYNLATNPYGFGTGSNTFGLGLKHSF